MSAFSLTATAGPDGRLRLELPAAAGQYQVDVTLTPMPPAPGWPPGFLDATFGCIRDEAFEAPPRGPVRPVPPLDDA